MTETELLNNEVTHRYSGNGYAVVEICPPTVSTLTGKTTNYARVTDKWCKSGQAFLAAVDHLNISMLSKGLDHEGQPYPQEPVVLTEEDMDRLRPLRDGISSGALKVISTRFVKQKQQPATV